MIVRFPTALYESAIPQAPGESGNVTYTISMEDPPRAAELVTRLPPAIELRKKSDDKLTDAERRANMGKLAYSFSKSNQDAVGSSKKQFESGQVLEFTTETPPALDPMKVRQETQVRHDTNILDLSGLGISDEDIQTITSSSPLQLKEFYADLNDYKQQRKAAEIAIAENQKQQNETKKAISAITELLPTNPELQSVVNDLEIKLADLKDDMAEQIDNANVAAALAEQTVDQIRNLAQVVR